MNDLGRDALVKAALDGVPQAFGWYTFGKARCALGVLVNALGVEVVTESSVCEMERVLAFGLSPRVCPECGREWSTENSLIVHLNDDHRFDFLTIARKLADPDAEPGGVV